MTAIIEKPKYTEEEREAFKAKREEHRDLIKKMVEAQIIEKKLLRSPHHLLPEAEYTGLYSFDKTCKYTLSGVRRAARLTDKCKRRRYHITQALIEYKKFLGKPWDMHEYKD